MRIPVLISSAVVMALGLGGLGYTFANARVSALNDPGSLEASIALRAKRWLVARTARREVPPAPALDSTRVIVGGMQFRASCATCHGLDGRSPTDLGQGMYPRASNLGAPATQVWSNRELFWIIRNGIRLTGMPAFGRVHSDDRIWDLVAYVRQIGREQSASNSSRRQEPPAPWSR